MEEKIQILVKTAHEIIDTNDKNTAIIVITQHNSITCNISGNNKTIGNLLYSVAKKIGDFANLITAVSNTLQEDAEDN